MKYELALEQMLAEARAGRDPGAVIARHPQYADALRADLALARSLSAAQPPLRPAAPQSMQLPMLSELARARASRSAPSHSHGRTWVFGGAFGAVAAALVAAVVISGALGGLYGSPSTAEAAFDGVVLDNSGGTLTIQTPTGVETVAAPVAATSGPARPAAASVQAGSFVSVQGKRLKNGTIASNAITEAALSDWCDTHSDQCLQLKTNLERQVQACQRNPAVCAAVAARLNDLEQKLEGHTRQILDLDSRCQQGAAAACSELKTFCASHANLCSRLNGKASGIASAMVMRLQRLKDACASDASRCADLKTYCTQRPEVCAGVRKDLQDLQDSLRNRKPPAQ
ncbi:MAG TPA: hypothetical protein VH951_13285 [Dehalococcoidia bacterium]